MATNNGTYGVQNDAYAHSLNNSNASAPIATRGGSMVIKKEIIKVSRTLLLLLYIALID